MHFGHDDVERVVVGEFRIDRWVVVGKNSDGDGGMKFDS
jgi:hypothetical protein